MQNFRTEVSPAVPPFSISHSNSMVSIGSCFSENIGKKFLQSKFNISINPFGQQYNPYSIAQGIERLISGKLYTENDLVLHNELYHSFDHHSSFSASTAQATLQHVNERLLSDSQAIKTADYLFITFGTAHCFALKESGRIVSNCHKMPGKVFNRQLLEPANIFDCISHALQKLLAINSKVKVIFTVSPVRYFAFGEFENSISKAHLFAAIHQLLSTCSNSYYFPAYELVIDDLRDYRFYAEDLLHPNILAINYVWNKLSDTYFSSATKSLLKEIEEISNAADHRPRNAKSDAHKKFTQNYLQKINVLQSKYNLNFEPEKNKLHASLKTAG